MPGSPIFHGSRASTAPQGMGGAARIQADTAPAKTNDMTFFIWLAVIGIILPVLIIGGLKGGGFQFVFKHR